MTISEIADETNRKKPVRLGLGVILVLLQWGIRYGLPYAGSEYIPFAVIGGLLGGVAVLVWWAFFSRAPKLERWGGVLLILVTMVVTSPFLHESIATAMMGLMFTVYSLPLVCLALVVWAVSSRSFSARRRRITMVGAILVVCGAWTLVRTDGMTGDLDQDFAWRWAETAEEKLLAEVEAVEAVEREAPAPVSASVSTPAEWPGFRGPERDGVVRGTRIGTDWEGSPPTELWRRRVGPGCSSFAFQGGLLYTQEQRGEDEVVSCYEGTSGAPVWQHKDRVRFWDSHAGAGPRGTPTVEGGRVFAFGGTGILNVLDALTGAVLWSRDVSSETGATEPGWGFTSSPLILDDLVVVHAGALVAYDVETGDRRWSGSESESYSSPHRMTLDGIPQVVLLSAAGVSSVAPSNGGLLWEHSWTDGARVVQPGLTASGELLISAGERGGLRRIAVTRGEDGWQVQERWTTRRLKPYFNDFVVHRGHAYGFDGRILACVDLETGQRKWKGGRYGHGQLLLLSDQSLLLVISERGELALVTAESGEFTELGRLQGIEGKTWNHPVLVGDLLFVRNGEEMAAFRLALVQG